LAGAFAILCFGGVPLGRVDFAATDCGVLFAIPVFGAASFVVVLAVFDVVVVCAGTSRYGAAAKIRTGMDFKFLKRPV